MENFLHDKNDGTLLLTREVFVLLFNQLVTFFKKKHHISAKYSDSQLFGFGGYNPEKPSIKSDLEALFKGYINGKYLYNKFREASSGKPVIKISGDYTTLFFNYIGYKNLTDFVNDIPIKKEVKIGQLELLAKDNTTKDCFYVCYYFGEDNQMYKGQVIIYGEWKTVEMIYVYEDDLGEKGVYNFHGTITQSEDFAFFDTKYYLGSKKHEGARYIFFIGKSTIYERQYLIGTYSGFDKYHRAISGKMILKKFKSREETEQELKDKTFDPIICQELNKNRVVVESNIRKNPLVFSKNSPYAQILIHSEGIYNFQFILENFTHELKLSIEKYHLNIISLDESIIIEDDRIVVLSNGQILNLDFSISGMFYLQKVSVYIRVLDFMNSKTSATGNFNGFSNNNEIVSGVVKIERITNLV